MHNNVCRFSSPLTGARVRPAWIRPHRSSLRPWDCRENESCRILTAVGDQAGQGWRRSTGSARGTPPRALLQAAEGSSQATRLATLLGGRRVSRRLTSSRHPEVCGGREAKASTDGGEDASSTSLDRPHTACLEINLSRRRREGAVISARGRRRVFSVHVCPVGQAGVRQRSTLLESRP